MVFIFVVVVAIVVVSVVPVGMDLRFFGRVKTDWRPNKNQVLEPVCCFGVAGVDQWRQRRKRKRRGKRRRRRRRRTRIGKEGDWKVGPGTDKEEDPEEEQVGEKEKFKLESNHNWISLLMVRKTIEGASISTDD